MSKFPGRVITDLAPAGYSVFFDGTGDWLQTPSNAAFGFGTGDATVEAWIYPTTVAGTQVFIDTRVSAAAGIGFYLSGSTLTVAKDFATNLLQGGTVTVNAWNHVAWTRSGSTNRLFLNGVQTTSTTDSTNYPTAKCVIGANDTGGQNLTGYISNVRIIKGTALYTAAFTPPTQLFNITNTQLLTCNSPAIIDQSSNNFAITVNGNSAVSTFTPFTAYVPYNPALGASTPGVWTVDEAMQAAATRQWNMYDPYFNLTTLLLHGNGTNGAQNNTFLDSSSNNFSITRNGNTTQGSYSPFSQTGWSNYFGGTSDYLSVGTITALGSGDFTISAWVYPQKISAGVFHVGGLPSAVTGVAVFLSGTAAEGWGLYAKNSQAVSNTGAITLNKWYYLTVIRSGTTTTLFVDGVSAVVISADNTNYTQTSLVIGGFFSSSFLISGYISNFRIVGSALTATVPTAPFTAVSGTTLLTCQSNRFIDNGTANSGSGFTVTTVGTPSVQPFSPFLPTVAYTPQTIGGSGYFDGTGDYLSMTIGSSTIGAGDFTIELWYYPTAFQNFDTMFSTTRGANGFNIGTNASASVVWYSSSAEQINSGVLRQNAWNHIAFTRTSNTLRLYLNGSQTGATPTVSTNFSATTCWVGDLATSGTEPAQGYISGLRVVTQSLASGSTYTVPTAPPTAITNTSLLLNFTNAGVVDSTADNVLETVGNAQISTAVSRFGGSSMFFDGNGDYLYLPSNRNLELGTGDFTLECWVYATSTPSDVGIFESRTDGNTATTNGFTLTAFSSSVIRIYSGAILISSSGTSYVNTWCHVAVTRVSGTFNLYINGVSQGTSATSRTLSNTDAIIGAGRYGGTSTINAFFPGYIDDFRITRGYARYTGNFTPQTSQWQDQ